MAIPIAKFYSAASWGSASKVVQCEHCRKTFAYLVRRRGQGEGTSPLFLDNEGAQQRAAQLAQRDLRNALDKAVEVVPCPACGWIQSDMQALARRQYRPRWKIAGISLLVGLCIPSLMLLGAVQTGPNEPLRVRMVVEILTIMVLQFTAGVGLLVGRALRAEHYDPNGEDVEARLKKGRARAVLLDELEKTKHEGTK